MLRPLALGTTGEVEEALHAGEQEGDVRQPVEAWRAVSSARNDGEPVAFPLGAVINCGPDTKARVDVLMWQGQLARQEQSQLPLRLESQHAVHVVKVGQGRTENAVR